MPHTGFSYSDVVNVINEILAKHGVPLSITTEDITITDRTVSDMVKEDQRLSLAIVDNLWPTVSEQEVFHFTSADAAEAILASNTFRLTNIERRFDDGEVRVFCESHQLTGYLEPDGNGEPLYRHLIMPNTYYASFTRTTLDEDEQRYFWQTFASGGGARLRMRVVASNPNFRRIRYETKRGTPIPILADLSASLKGEFGREFILSGISRLCSFYLSGEDYEREQEYRMLYRVWEGFGPQPVGAGANSYVEVPLGVMSDCGYEVHVVDVCAESRPSMPADITFVRRLA